MQPVFFSYLSDSLSCIISSSSGHFFIQCNLFGSSRCKVLESSPDPISYASCFGILHWNIEYLYADISILHSEMSNEKICWSFVQERDTTKEELMGRWSLWYKLPNPSWTELYICDASKGSDWKLLLLPHSWLPQGCWRLWWHQSTESSTNPCAVPSTSRGFHFTHRRLVQDQSHCKIESNLEYPCSDCRKNYEFWVCIRVATFVKIICFAWLINVWFLVFRLL